MTVKEQRQKVIDERIAYIQNLYLTDDRMLTSPYSGGKDSTVATSLVTLALLGIPKEKREKKVVVMMSDTLMEMDNTISKIHASLKRLKEFAKKYDLPIEVKVVEPEIEETFFTNVIGKGYQLFQQQWCVDRLKIRPQKRYIATLEGLSPKGIITIVGSRSEESAERAQRLKDSTIDGIMKKHDFNGWGFLAPIEDFSTADVWAFIHNNAPEWVDADALENMYSELADDGDECRTMLEGKTGELPQCGNSLRYGCYLCPKQHSRDKALEGLAKKYDYMKKIESFRNWLMSEGEGWKQRRFYRNDSQGVSIYDKNDGDNAHRYGMISPSGYTLEFRKEILSRLYALSEEVKKQREGKPLITKEELMQIQRLWLQEGDYLSLSAENITGLSLISNTDKEYIQICKNVDTLLFKSCKYGSRTYNSVPYVKGIVDERRISYLVKEFMKKRPKESVVSFVKSLISFDYNCTKRQAAVHWYLNSTTYTKMLFLTDDEQRIRQREWDEDRISFLTYLNEGLHEKVIDPDTIEFSLSYDYMKQYKKTSIVFQRYEKQHKQYEEYLSSGEDFIECKNVSLEEKLAYLDSF